MPFRITPHVPQVPATAATGVLAVAIFCLTAPAEAQCIQESLTTPTADLDNSYGHAVDANGSALIVGAPRDQVGGRTAGTAWVHRLAGTVFTSPAPLVAPDPQDGDRFGADVAIENDLALVAAPDRVDDGAISGRVYLYQEIDGDWTFERSFASPAPASRTDRFGAAVAVSAERLFIGAPGHTDLGAVFIYERDSSTEAWFLAETLLGEDFLDQGATGTFGDFLDVNGDRLVVSAPVAEIVFAFERQTGSSDWTLTGEVEEVPPSVTPSGFGRGVAIDGDALVVGSPFDDEAASNAGAITVFRRQAGGDWSFEAKLFASDAAGFAGFGAGCGISCDHIVTGSGSRGYTFARHGDTWIETGMITPPVGTVGGTSGSPNQFDISGDVGVLGGAGFFNATGRAHIVRGITARDCNGNGLGDACEIIDGVAEDLDGNGIPDDCLAGDLTADAEVDIADLLTLLANWGPCDDDCDCPADLNGDGAADITDLLTVLANWTG